jgi:hypothetical protein
VSRSLLGGGRGTRSLASMGKTITDAGRAPQRYWNGTRTGQDAKPIAWPPNSTLCIAAERFTGRVMFQHPPAGGLQPVTNFLYTIHVPLTRHEQTTPPL